MMNQEEVDRRKDNWVIIQKVLDSCELETLLSYEKFPDFNSLYEVYAVLKEEVDELWDETKVKDRDISRLEVEATHVVALAIRALLFINKTKKRE